MKKTVVAIATLFGGAAGCFTWVTDGMTVQDAIGAGMGTTLMIAGWCVLGWAAFRWIAGIGSSTWRTRTSGCGSLSDIEVDMRRVVTPPENPSTRRRRAPG